MEEQKFEAWNQPQPEPQPQYRPDNKKVAAGILAILLGGLGVHKFVLGYTTEGILQIVFSIITCGIAGSLIGLIEGIIYLTKTDEEFYQMYQVNKKGWF
ncbi:MAG: TM2 domain-containing protein [Flavobacteriaceae bacterium]|nr:TM2 domain-containing protein [Bacteroidota bacterium]